jgi:hypothetical protein
MYVIAALNVNDISLASSEWPEQRSGLSCMYYLSVLKQHDDLFSLPSSKRPVVCGWQGLVIIDHLGVMDAHSIGKGTVFDATAVSWRLMCHIRKSVCTYISMRPYQSRHNYIPLQKIRNGYAQGMAQASVASRKCSAFLAGYM